MYYTISNEKLQAGGLTRDDLSQELFIPEALRDHINPLGLVRSIFGAQSDEAKALSGRFGFGNAPGLGDDDLSFSLVIDVSTLERLESLALTRLRQVVGRLRLQRALRVDLDIRKDPWESLESTTLSPIERRLITRAFNLSGGEWLSDERLAEELADQGIDSAADVANKRERILDRVRLALGA